MNYTFIVGSSKLKEALSITSKGLSSSRVTPITEDYLFKVNGNELTICTTNMKVFINKTIAIESESIIDIVLPSGKLNDLTRELPDQPLIFEVTEYIEKVPIPGGDKMRDEKRFYAHLKTPSGIFKLNAENGENFPVQKIEDGDINTIDIPADDFLACLYKTTFAVSKDELRPVLTGVVVDFTPEGVRFSASDAHIASTVFLKVETNLNQSILIALDCLSLIHSLGLKWPSVSISFSKSTISFTLGSDLVISGRLIGENPFDLKSIIPAGSDVVTTVDRQSLISVINRVKGFSKGDNIKISLSDNNINVFAENEGTNETGNEDLNAIYEGVDFEVGVISKQILGCLNKCASNDVSLFFTTPNRAFLIRESNEIVDSENLMFVMPVKI